MSLNYQWLDMKLSKCLISLPMQNVHLIGRDLIFSKETKEIDTKHYGMYRYWMAMFNIN